MEIKSDIYKLQSDKLRYKQQREYYLKAVYEAEEELKNFDKIIQADLLKQIKLRKEDEFKLFCKSAKYLYKNRDEIKASGFAYCCTIDFLEFNYAKKILLKDLLDAWEYGLTYLDEDGNECLVIGIKSPQFDRSNNPRAEIHYLKGSDEYIGFISSKDYDKWFYSVKPSVDDIKLTNSLSDFEDYHTLLEIPHKFLNIEEW